MSLPELTEVPDWLVRVRRRLRPWRGRAVVVAVSGGADSVGLLGALVNLVKLEKLSLSVAHLDHGIRGESSAADARFVADLAAGLGLPFDLGRWSPDRSSHLETEARRARYRWLAELARKRGAAAVAVGHTRDDQAETILHRILRGTGLHGLAGMPARRDLIEGVTLIRPILEVGRSEIRAYLEALGQPWREDAMNADPAYTRSRIRLDLIPKLREEYNPRIEEALLRLGQLADAERRASRGRLARIVRNAWIDDPTGSALLALRLDRLSALPVVARAEAIRHAWRSVGGSERAMSRRHWRGLADLAGPRPKSRRISLPGRRMAERRGSELWVLQSCESSQVLQIPAETQLSLPGQSCWRGGRLVAVLDAGGPGMEWIDADRLQPFGSPEAPYLVIRAPRVGERFDPLGMGGRTTRLGDFLRGRGVPAADRRLVPLLVDRRGIVWVVGHRIADRVRRDETSRRRLGLRWETGGEGGSPPSSGCD